MGDTIALSVATPQHLKKVNLLEEVNEDEGNKNCFATKRFADKF